MFIMKAPMGIFIMQREPVQLVLPKLKLDLGHWDLLQGSVSAVVPVTFIGKVLGTIIYMKLTLMPDGLRSSRLR